MRKGETERDTQVLRLRVRRNYCWDEKIEKGEKNPCLCHVSWHDMTCHARTGRGTTDKTHGLRWARVVV